MTRRLRSLTAPFWATAIVVAWGAGCSNDDILLYEVPATNAPTAGAQAAGGALGGAGSAGYSGSDAGAQGGVTSGGAGASSGASGSAGEPGIECGTIADCPTGWSCEKRDCSAERGTCSPPTVLCPTEPAPVCGCDGVTYWNDCVRRKAASAGSTPGECRGGARRCRTADDCGMPEAACARLYPPQPQLCSASPEGSCWVLPATCGEQGPPWIRCPEGRRPPSTPPPCVSTCDAIRSGEPHIAPLPGVPCP